MPKQANWVENVGIKVGGTALSRALMNDLVEVVVDTSLHLPAMFVMRFHDDRLQWLDDGPFELGASVEIELGAMEGKLARVIKAEITAIEPDYTQDLAILLTIRGYDRSHRLSRGTKSEVFVQMSDSEIVNKIASQAGLQVEAESTTPAYEHVYQDNLTDLAFIQELARRNGYEVFVDDMKLYFRSSEGERGEASLEWGDTLRSFHPRLTLIGQVNEVIVKGWDPATKKEITGKANSSEIVPRISVGGDGGKVAQKAFSAAKQYVVRHPVTSQDDADNLAQAVLDDVNAGFVEAEGIAAGNPQLVAGSKVKLDKLGKRFNGTYVISSAVHLYNQEGYDVHFRIEGARAKLMSDLVNDTSSSSNGHSSSWGGVVPAIVTNNKDPKEVGRVKVKFPWLQDTLESTWVRVAGVGAGPERGIYWLPEVNDEVLVAFEHGDFNRPYIIGGLWNGMDKPPEKTDDVIKQGKVEIRTIKTRTGHTIRLVDDSAGQFIEIIDSEKVNHIKLDVKSKKMEITTKGEVLIKSDKDTTIESGAAMNIKAQGNLSIKGSANVNVEATGQLVLKGATVNIN